MHLGRTEPGEYLVQVTEEAVNIIQEAGSGVFELAASWRPPSLPFPPFPSFKVQHAGTAGNIVAVICDDMMLLIQVQEGKLREVAAHHATGGRIDGENPAGAAPSAAVKAQEVLRTKLDGGPVSALGMRLLGSIGDAQEGVGREYKPIV